MWTIFSGLGERMSRWFPGAAVSLGVDIHAGHVRAVVLKRDREGRWSVAAVGAMAADVFAEHSVDRDRVAAFLQSIAPGYASTMMLEHPTLLIRRMSIAPMPEADLVEAIRWNFREHVNCPIERLRVGYTPLPGYDEGGRHSLLAFAVDTVGIQTALSVAQDLHLKVARLEPAATALLAAFYENGQLTAHKYRACLVLEAQVATFLVMTDKMLLFSRPLPSLTLNALTEPKTAEDFIGHLLIEVERSIDAFCIMYGVDHVDALSICGDTVSLPGLVDHLQHSLGIVTDVFDPFATFSFGPGVEAVSPTIRPLFAVAVGLAIP